MGDSTPSPGGRSLGPSASLRDSEVEYLQAEAREWLEAVLEEKLDPGESLQDLLADGTVLYRVSQIVKEHLGKVQGWHPPAGATPSPDVNRRTSLKYQPYSYVEAFLKVCKDVGLLDLDLFNPSDAVDKKDIRHVCVCLRRLSKQARTLSVQLPEFDNVKHALLRSPSHKHTVDITFDPPLQQPSLRTPSRFKNENPGRHTLSDPSNISLASDVARDEHPQEVLGSVSKQPIDLVEEGEADLEATTWEMEAVDLKPVSAERSLGPEEPDATRLEPTLDDRPPAVCGTSEKSTCQSRRPWFPYAAAAAVLVGAVVVVVVARERRQLCMRLSAGDNLARNLIQVVP